MVAHGRAGHKAPTVWSPENFDPISHLPPRLWTRADGARWFLGTIIRRGMFGKSDEGFIGLSSIAMRSTLGQNTWSGLLKALGPFLETRNHVSGVRCRGYRIHGLGDAPRRVPIQDPELAAKLLERRDVWQREHEAKLLPVHKRLRAIQRKHLTITKDIDGAIAELPEQSRLIQRAIVQAIRERRSGFSISGTGRVFNAISGMKRTLREHIRLAGEPVAEVDIVSSQPALLGQLFPPNGLKGPSTYYMYSSTTPPSSYSRDLSGVARRVASFYDRLPSLLVGLSSDAREFAEVASGGYLYEELLASWDAKGLPYPKNCSDRRHWIKKRFLVDVLNYHPADHERPLVRLVRERWPSVVRFAAEANRLHRGTLIASLQRLESWLVIEQVAPRLIAKDVLILTLHDAVFCREQDYRTVCQTFYGVCEEVGYDLKLKEKTRCALAV